MLSIATAIGLVSFSILILVISGILRQLGAGEVAKGLVIATGFAVVTAFAMTYLPSLLLP